MTLVEEIEVEYRDDVGAFIRMRELISTNHITK